MTTPGPPRKVEQWLAGFVPGGERGDSILGDLEEEYRLRSPQGPRRADMWYAVQSLALAARFALKRLARRRRTKRRPSMSQALRDFRLAFRNLLHEPGYALIVVATLALGIGANAAVFSMVDALVLRPFPLPDIDRLVMLYESVPQKGETREAVAPANFLDWKAQSTGFEELAAFEWWDVNLTGSGEPERLQGTLATPRFFETLGVEPSLGRTLARDQGSFDAKTVVLSHAFWERRFAGDRAVVGETIVLNGARYDVVGVAPEDFDYPYGADVWSPLFFDGETAADRESHYLRVIGKLPPGRTLDAARSELAVVAERLEREHPATNEGRGAHAMSLARAVVDIGLPAFLVVWQSTSLFVLLIACVNVANILLARGLERQKEISLQQALGASRARIVRRLLTENLLLSLVGALLALPLAWLGLRVLVSSLPAHIQRFVVGWREIDLDPRVLAFTAAVSIFTTFVFGLVPALRASRPQLAATLKEGGRGGSGGPGRQRLRTLLVVSEVALALMLLVASGLCVRGAIRMAHADQGYDPEGLMTFEVALPESKYDTDQEQRQFFEDLLARLRGLGAVVSADVANVLPSSGNNFGRSIEVEGRPALTASERPRADFRVVTPSYFETMRIPLERGRAFSQEDGSEGTSVAIVSERFASRYWPGEDALGERFRFGDEDGPWTTVVGVSGDILQDWFLGEPQPTFYVPLAQRPRRGAHLVLRTRGEPEAVMSAVREQVRRVDPELPVFNVMSLRVMLHERMIGIRYAAGVMAVLGGIALVLSAVGIYGLIAYAVSRRAHEIGVRVALGASRGDVLRLTVSQAMRVIGVGIAVGLLLAYAAGRFMESSLFGIVQLEPVTFAALALALLGISLVAGIVPARRALSVDPAVALRAE